MITYTLKVDDIRKETKDAITICFKQPGLKKIKYNSGQYLTLIVRINGKRYQRPYSLSSTPGIDSLLEITVKRVKNGVVSNYLNDKVIKGDVFEVLPPMGKFLLQENECCNIIFFWGIGSGITPLYSMIKFILHFNPESHINLIYGNKNKESTIFHDSLNDLEMKHLDRFKIWNFRTNSEEEEDKTLNGRIQPKIILDKFESDIMNKTLHYICGPLDFKNLITKNLISHQVKRENIFSEHFEFSLESEELKKLKDRTVKLHFNNSEMELLILKKKTILESALNVGINLPYSCRTGDCNSCVGELKSGKLKMFRIDNQKNTLKENDYLMCCSYPLSDNIVIKI